MTVRADPGVLFICCKLLFALQAKRDSLRFRARRHIDGEDHLQRRKYVYSTTTLQRKLLQHTPCRERHMARI